MDIVFVSHQTTQNWHNYLKDPNDAYAIIFASSNECQVAAGDSFDHVSVLLDNEKKEDKQDSRDNQACQRRGKGRQGLVCTN